MLRIEYASGKIRKFHTPLDIEGHESIPDIIIDAEDRMFFLRRIAPLFLSAAKPRTAYYYEATLIQHTTKLTAIES